MRPVPRSRRLLAHLAPLALAGALLPSRAALAQAPPAAKPQTVSLPAGAGQDALWAQLGEKGIVARACPGACGPAANTTPLSGVPNEVLPALATAKTSTLTLEGGRRVARIDAEIPAKPGETP